MRRMVRLINSAGLAMGSGLCGMAIAGRARAAELSGRRTDDRGDPPIVVEAGRSRQPNAPGWDALFDALLGDLQTYAKARVRGRSPGGARIASIRSRTDWARSPGRRPRPCARKSGNGFDRGFAWRGPGARLERHGRGAARDDRSRASRPIARAGSISCKNDLGHALCAITTPPTPSPSGRPPCTGFMNRWARCSTGIRASPGGRRAELEAAVNDLFNQPNLDVAADV